MRKWNIFSVLRYHFIAVLIVFLVFAAGAEILFPNTDRRIVYGGCLLLALLVLTVVFNILPGSPDRVALRRKERRARGSLTVVNFELLHGGIQAYVERPQRGICAANRDERGVSPLVFFPYLMYNTLLR